MFLGVTDGFGADEAVGVAVAAADAPLEAPEDGRGVVAAELAGVVCLP